MPGVGLAPSPALPTACSEVDLLVRQVRAIETWNCARRQREDQPTRTAGLSREARMDAGKRLGVLHEVQRAVQARAAAALGVEPRPLSESAAARVVIAHRQPWFVTTMTAALAGCGLSALSYGENGAAALGLTIAEQPDLLLVGHVLGMLSTHALIAEAAVFAPRTRVVVQVPDTQDVDAALAAGAHAAHPRRVPPAALAAEVAGLLGRGLQAAST